MQAGTESEVVAAVRWACDQNKPLEIFSSGTKRAFGRPITGEPLDVSGLEGIVSYEPEELILTAKPGTRLSEVRAALDARRQQLGFDPPEWARFFGSSGESTLGGVLSVDAAGSARVRYGGPRDHLLGIRGVNGFGDVFRAGGRVVKNVTGFDIPKLICGGFGTLCVLTEVTLRVYPKPPLCEIFALRDLAVAEGLSLLRRVWSSPLESSGLSYVPRAGLGTAFIRLDGTREALGEKVAFARSLLQGHELENQPSDAFPSIDDGSMFDQPTLDVWRVYTPPSQALGILEAVRPIQWLADWAGGLLWLGLEASDQAHDSLEHTLKRYGAQALLMRASPASRRQRVIVPSDDDLLAVARAVKTAFDPMGLFNRGRMYEGL